MDKIKDILPLFSTGCDGCPDAFAPAHSGLAAGLLGFTISLDGGLEELRESFLSRATSSSSYAMRLRSVSIRCLNSAIILSFSSMHHYITQGMGKRKLPILTFSGFYEKFCERLRFMNVILKMTDLLIIPWSQVRILPGPVP